MPKLVVPDVPATGPTRQWAVDLVRSLREHDRYVLKREGTWPPGKGLYVRDGEDNLFILEQVKTYVRRATVSGPSVVLTDMILRGYLVYGAFVEVLKTITGPTSFDVGHQGDLDSWGRRISLDAGTRTTFKDFTNRNIAFYFVNDDLILTPHGADFTGGEVEVTMRYSDFEASFGDGRVFDQQGA